MKNLLLYILYFSATCAYSQENINTIKDSINIDTMALYKTITKGWNVGIRYNQIIDQGHSPLLYNGFIFALDKYKKRVYKNAEIYYSLSIALGDLSNTKDVSYPEYILTFYSTIDLGWQFYLSQKKSTIKLGPQLGNIIDSRLYPFLPNNAGGYEIAHSINTHFTYERPIVFFQKDRLWKIKYDLATSLFAYTNRPNYIGLTDAETYMNETPKVGAFFKTYHFVPANQFYKINSKISLERYNLKTNKWWTISYEWMYHKTDIKNSNPLYYSFHQFSIGRSIIKNKPRKNNYSFKKKIINELSK